MIEETLGISTSTWNPQQRLGHQWSSGHPAGSSGHSLKKGFPSPKIQWIGLREDLQETPIFNGKITLVSG